MDKKETLKNKDKEDKNTAVYKEVAKTNKLFYLDSIYASIKDGINNNFVIPFALALKAPNDIISIINAAPNLVGSFFQLFTSDLINILKSRKKVIVFAALIDALMWLPIILIPFLWSKNYFLLINFLIIQAISNSILNPFFNSLLADIVSTEQRGKVLARMNQLSSLFSLLSSLIAGFVLSSFKNINSFIGFGIIFFTAFFSRLVSTLIKTRFYEPNHKIEEKKELSFFKFLFNIRKSNFGQFVMYNSWIKFAVGMSAPFFSVYMLQYLKMDYLTYSIVNGGAIISSFLVLNLWGKTIDEKGSRWMLGIGGLLIPLIPVFWIIFKDPWILFIIELFSGAAWAAYNLSTSNFVLESTSKEERIRMLSYYNFFAGFATFIGAFIGGKLMTKLPLDYFGNLFYFVFGLSALLRLIFSLYFLRKIKSERFTGLEIISPIERRITSIIPKEGTLWELIPYREIEEIGKKINEKITETIRKKKQNEMFRKKK
ncbi:MAG: MFS transporter [Candidatus Woesearchaeota archaeon]